MDYSVDTDCFKGLLIQPQDVSYEFLPSLRSYQLEIRERPVEKLRYVKIQAFLSIMLGAADRTKHHLKFKALDLPVNSESIEDPDRLQEDCDLESWQKQAKQAVEQVGRLVEALLAMVKFRNLARMCFEHSMRHVAKKIAGIVRHVARYPAHMTRQSAFHTILERSSRLPPAGVRSAKSRVLACSPRSKILSVIIYRYKKCPSYLIQPKPPSISLLSCRLSPTFLPIPTLTPVLILDGPAASKLLPLDITRRAGQPDSFSGCCDSVFGG